MKTLLTQFDIRNLTNKKVLFVLFTCLVCFISWQVLKLPVSEWSVTNWIYDYQFEFIKRGLTGHTLSAISNDKLSLDFLRQVILIVYILLASLILMFAWLRLRSTPLLALTFLIAGFSIQQFAYDIGRLDQINYILTFACIFLLQSQLPKSIIFLLTTSLCVVMLCVHEASALINIPLVFSLYMLITKTKGDTFYSPAIFILVQIIVFISIAILGSLTEVNFEHFINYLNDKVADFDIRKDAASIYSMNLNDNISLTLERLNHKKTLSRMVRILIVSLPFILILRHWYKQLTSNGDYLTKILLLIPVISILPLFILGIDFYRWIAMMLLNMTLLMACYQHSLKKPVAIHKGYYIAAIIAAIYGGPYGVSVAMPDRLAIFSL